MSDNHEKCMDCIYNNPLDIQIKSALSVIIPVFNVDPYLNECVLSVISQSMKSIEVILIDDGSTDQCSKLCDLYASLDPRIIVIHQKNGGLSKARNSGLALAESTYVSFIDSDDCISPEMFYQMINCMDSVDILECGVERFTNKEDIIEVLSRPENIIYYSREDALQRLFDYPGMSSSFCNKIFRKELFDGIQFREGIIHEDEHLIFRIIDRSKSFGYIDTPYYYYRYRNNSIMTIKSSIKQLDAVWVWEDRRSYCLQRGYADFALRSEANLYYECSNLYRKKFFRSNQDAKQYLEQMIDKYKPIFIHNKYIAIKHRAILFAGKLYRLIH